MKEDARLRCHVGGEEELGSIETPTKDKFAPQVFEANTARARIDCGYVLVAAWVVELGLATVHDRRIASEFAEIDLRTVDS